MPWPPFLVNVLRLPTIRLTPTTDCGSPVAESYQGCTEEGRLFRRVGVVWVGRGHKLPRKFFAAFPPQKKMTASHKTTFLVGARGAI